MDTMLSKALREFITGPLNQLIVNLGGRDSGLWTEELKKFLRKEPCWVNNKDSQIAKSKLTPSILQFISAIGVSATTGEFVAKKKFQVNAKDNDSVKISGVGQRFEQWFLLGDGKIEELMGKQILYYHTSHHLSAYGPIISELGGEAEAETCLSEVWSLMEKQKYGEDGILLNDGCSNIFFIKDISGVLRVVVVSWVDDGGWYVDAISVRSMLQVDAWSLVFAHNFVL
jgi:hypothetical protein